MRLPLHLGSIAACRLHCITPNTMPCGFGNTCRTRVGGLVARERFCLRSERGLDRLLLDQDSNKVVTSCHGEEDGHSGIEHTVLS